MDLNKENAAESTLLVEPLTKANPELREVVPT
jgi:hypothetical protein